MTKYSAFDIQLNKICDICNKRSPKSVINGVRKIVSVEDDIGGLSDNDVFSGWGYILFSHTKRVAPNNVVSLEYLACYDEIEILLPEILDGSW